MTPAQYAQLMRLSSPALPVGGFSYSQGLESAVELGIVKNEADAGQWIEETLHTVMTGCDAVIWIVLSRAWRLQDFNVIRQWNQWYYASRETAEARAETTQMGISLINLIGALQWASGNEYTLLTKLDAPCFPTVHACAVAALKLPEEAGVTALLFAWVENQVMAAIRTIPLGQTAGQRLLSALIPQLDLAVRAAQNMASQTPPAIRTLAPQYAVVAARHESQFSRLFRS
ncbi:urease accessory protein UreF [Advenella mimigardefordensis]|uniref:Urease accessory protein UreF n=1 Tax=Advenella mimigardefordensis (strain DSM 17166 / LMG 22922 / DPN7) TaxID=1247726 RepID=W0PBQ7_ADVMD|nr:urease accessory UreF family protein [Advenella mimigardefordensis]AHG64294.1 urease accessory protein UreF [Advenella mimigardefordensis DPN7]